MKKNPWNISEADAFRAKFQDFCAETGGLIRIYLLRYNDAGMVTALERCDPVALTMAQAVAKSLRLIERKASAHLCLLCNHEFDGTKADQPDAFVIWLPTTKTEKFGEHNHVITQPVCAACCRSSDRKIMDGAVSILRLVMPTTEVIEETEDFIDE